MIRKLIITSIFICSFTHAATIENEIKQLREESNRLSERISRLEKKNIKSEQIKSVAYTQQSAWHDLSNWGKIKQGMSHVQVELILGKPTRKSIDTINYVKMYYQGNIPESGYVSGYVELDNNDRVLYSGVNPPVM